MVFCATCTPLSSLDGAIKEFWLVLSDCVFNIELKLRLFEFLQPSSHNRQTSPNYLFGSALVPKVNKKYGKVCFLLPAGSSGI